MSALRAGVVKAVIADTKRSTDADEDAYAEIQKSVRGAKPDDLLGFSTGEQVAVLRCLLRRTARKISRRRAEECIGFLLASPDWIRAAQGDLELLSDLKAGIEDPKIQSILASPVPDAQAVQAMKSKEVDLAKLSERKARMEQHLLSGIQKCRKLDWKFSKIDDGTEALRSLYDGAVQFHQLAEKAEPDQPVSLAVRNLNEAEAASLVGFLFEMHDSQVRKSMYNKIMEVVKALSRDSHFARQAASLKSWTPPGETASNPSCEESETNTLSDEPALQEAEAAEAGPARSSIPAAAAAAAAAGSSASASATPSPAPSPAAAAASSPKKATSPAGKDTRRPMVVWLDQKLEATNQATLQKNPNLGFVGIWDQGPDISAAALERLFEVLTSETSRLDVLIMNKKHLQLVADILDNCETDPLFIVVTRNTQDIPDSPEGAKMIFERDWGQAAEKAVQEVQRRVTARKA